jgi:hypothetical protein
MRWMPGAGPSTAGRPVGRAADAWLTRCRAMLESQHLAGSVTLLGLPYPIFFLPRVLGLTVMHFSNDV